MGGGSWRVLSSRALGQLTSAEASGGVELVSDIPKANKASEASAEESEQTWQTRAVFAAR